MNTDRIEVFKQFAKHLEYPIVVFEAETGNVIDINHEAEEILGGKAETIRIEPGRVYTKLNFWDVLHTRKCIIWHRIRMFVLDKEFLVSGLVNETEIDGKLIYTILFQCRSDLNIGSVTLERIVEHAGVVAMNLSTTENVFQVEYVSSNISQYGYTRAQFYEKELQVREIVCAEDQEKLRVNVLDAISGHADESIIECRILTGMHDLIPIRVRICYIYDDDDNLSEVELLVFDLREEYRKSQERVYLHNAISKMKSVVIVKAFKAGKRTLCYVSPNAGMIGMNAESLQKGYRLTEDYIHPEDRDSVMDAIYQAIANEITDYVQVYRMVTDDGRQIWVENEVTVNRITDGEAEITFLITDITEQKELEMQIATVTEETVPAEKVMDSSIDLITIDDGDTEMLQQLQMMADAIGKKADYYSVVLNAEGKQLTRPAGPASNMGVFYDIFERPQLKEEFTKIAERAKEQHIPQSTSFQVDNDWVHMVYAPLMMGDNIAAYWVLTSFAKDGAIVLGEVAEAQWKLADSIVKCFYLQSNMRKETKARKVSEMHLHKQQMEHRVIEDMITSMSREGKAAFSEMCYKAGVYLSVDNIGLYVKNKDSGNVEKYYTWSQTGEEGTFSNALLMSPSEYEMLKEQLAGKNAIIADYKTEHAFLREMARKNNQSFMICPLSVLSDAEGYIVFADGDRDREYDSVDQHFVITIAKIFESAIAGHQQRVVPDMLRTGLMESYDHFRDAVYVKDNPSGEIIFANKAIDKLFGYSLVGMQSSDVLTDTMGKYRNIGGITKRFIADKKVTKWQAYVKELDQIMNIVEVHMETLYGADWSVVILKKNKDKEKKKGKDKN